MKMTPLYCQCLSPNTKSRSLSGPVKSHPNIRQHWKDLKGIGSVFMSPTDTTIHQQLFELEVFLLQSSHVCPSDWMSCIGEGSDALSPITFKCSVFWELPPPNKSPCNSPVIEGEDQTEDIISGGGKGSWPPLCCHNITFPFSKHIH